jgi:DNA-binding transcriptional MerR regulator
MEEPRWTLDELAERVDTALAVDYHGQPSGRVRAVPDRRAIRWYTTIGLIDRPVAHRGRTALYGPRHLLQLVAVKRLQASGLPLVSIQQELAGATDTQLARVARLPAPGTLASGGDGLAGRGRAELGAAAAAAQPGVATPPGAIAPRPAAGKARRAGFWRGQPAAFSTAADTITAADPAGLIDRTDPSGHADPADPADPDDSAGPAGPVPDQAGTARAATLQGIRLGDGATLLLEPGRELGPEDVRAVLAAAGPLLAVLRDRGLGAGSPGPDQDQAPRRAGGTEPRREHP